MKKNTLKLSDIKVESFITNTQQESETIQGGNAIVSITEQLMSFIPGLGAGCITLATTQITAHTAEITETIINSHQQMNCAGATRAIVGCTNGGSFPCQLGCI